MTNNDMDFPQNYVVSQSANCVFQEKKLQLILMRIKEKKIRKEKKKQVFSGRFAKLICFIISMSVRNKFF